MVRKRGGGVTPQSILQKLTFPNGLIILHATTPTMVDLTYKGSYILPINTNTPYIVKIGAHYFPGTGELNQEHIDKIKANYTVVEKDTQPNTSNKNTTTDKNKKSSEKNPQITRKKNIKFTRKKNLKFTKNKK